MLEFKWLLSNDTATYLLDSQSIIVTKSDDNRLVYISIQIKIMPTNQGIKDEIALRKRYKKSAEGYEDYKYSLCHQIVSMSQNGGKFAIKNISRIDYNKNDDTLDYFTADNASFIDAIPDSIGDKVAQKTFNYVKAHNRLR